MDFLIGFLMSVVSLAIFMAISYVEDSDVDLGSLLIVFFISSIPIINVIVACMTVVSVMSSRGVFKKIVFKWRK